MVGDVKVNLIDTPGHADFISEVEHSLSVLDGAILVISAVEGVQAQTRILMEALKQQRIPTVMFMNKLDRIGADYVRIRTRIRQLLDERVCEMNIASNIGTSAIDIIDNEDKTSWLEVLALNSENLFAAYVAEKKCSERMLRRELIQQTKTARAFPLFAGAAVKGVGIRSLLTSLPMFFPSQKGGNHLTASVFKLIQLSSGEQEAYVRIYEGVICIRSEVPVIRHGNEPFNLKVKHLHKLENGKQVSTETVVAGDIAILTGRKLEVGDALGLVPSRLKHMRVKQPPIQVKASTRCNKDKAILHKALTRLAAEDPFLHYCLDQETAEHSIRLFGEVQQEVLKETILVEYGIQVEFTQPEMICIEKVVGTGSALERIDDQENPFYATIGFRVEKGEEGCGLIYQLEAELGSLPLAFQRAIQETVTQVLQEGLYGWVVEDVCVTLTHTGFSSPVSTARDFRTLTPLVLMQALKQAGTAVFEPLDDVQIVVPEQYLPKVLSLVTGHGGIVSEPNFINDLFEVNVRIAVRTSAQVKAMIRALTSGEGIVSARFGGYQKTGNQTLPVKQRRTPNALNRSEYLLYQSKKL